MKQLVKSKWTAFLALALLVCGVWVVFAAQDTTITTRQVRNPNELKTWLEANAADAESRLASGASTAATLPLINTADAGEALVSLTADNGTDAGDKTGVVGTDGAGIAFQTDTTSKGTLATKATMGLTGIFDMPSITVDAGAGIDCQAAGALLVGAVTATSVEIGDAAVATDVQGALTVLGTTGVGIDAKGATALYVGEATCTSLVLGASDIDTIIAGALTVLGTTTAGIDSTGATALYVGEETCTSLVLGASDITTIVSGPLTVLGSTGAGLDANGATALFIGEAVATSVSIGASDIDTTILGPLNVLEATGKGIDTTGAGALFLGEAVATSVSIGASDIDTSILGPLNVLEATGKGVDTTGAGALYLGEAVATSVVLGATDANAIIPGEATVDGKYAVVGPDATTGQMVLGASITSTGTTMTNTFATAFGAAPIVTMTYTESATTELYLGTITASNFISFHESSKNYAYTAIGQRP